MLNEIQLMIPIENSSPKHRTFHIVIKFSPKENVYKRKHQDYQEPFDRIRLTTLLNFQQQNKSNFRHISQRKSTHTE